MIAIKQNYSIFRQIGFFPNTTDTKYSLLNTIFVFMLSGFFGKNKQKKKSQRKKSKRRTKKNRTLEEKKAEWTSRWGSDDYEPFWDLKEMPESIIELIQKGTIPHGVKIVDIGCGWKNSTEFLF